MTKFTVAVQYWLPVWRPVQVDAANADLACTAALEAADADGWDSARHDYESSTGAGVVAMASGWHPNPYDAPARDALEVPAAHVSAVAPMIDAAPATAALVCDLWDFIENCTDDAPDRQDRFFALRARVRDAAGRACGQ